MEVKNIASKDSDWEVLLTFFPEEWQQKCKELGALRRCRKFAEAESLVRTLLIHLADGCSLRETAVRASEGNIANISDVALLKRLRASGEWFRWMAVELMKDWVAKQPSAIFGKNLRIRIIDGTTIQEPGSTGSTWRLHYSIGLPSLQCDEVYLTSPKVGESFKRFSVHAGDLFLADRGYAKRSGIGHIVRGGGNVIVRINLNVPLLDRGSNRYLLLEQLRTLSGTRVGDWNVAMQDEDLLIDGRVCAIKKSKEAAEKARRKIIKESKKKGNNPKPETLEAAEYIFVFTTLEGRLSATTILEMYRGRWQVELVFKRLKSIMGLGHLKKTDIEAAKAWIHGKLFVAFLIEALIIAGESFFPWGYPIHESSGTITMPVERDILYAPSS
ncbi:MAG: IS4 family transposase [Pseudomonadota bacterium]